MLRDEEWDGRIRIAYVQLQIARRPGADPVEEERAETALNALLACKLDAMRKGGIVTFRNT